MRSSTELALIRAILDADEDDDEPRLVYADYLMDRQDPRGELIVVQCREARTSNDEIEDRALNLFDAGETHWLGAWHGEANRWRFRRGFLHDLAVPLDAFVTLAALLFDADPCADELVHVQSLELSNPREPHSLAASAHDVEPFAAELGAIFERLRLRTLIFEPTPNRLFLEALGRGALSHLTSLRLLQIPNSQRFCEWLLQGLALDQLHTLDLPTLADNQARILAAQPRYAQIRRLVLGPCSVEAAIMLVTKNLTSLELSGRTTDDFLAALAQVRPPLVELTLRRSLARTFELLTSLTTLERLNLRATWIGDEVIDPVLALPRLTALNLAHTRITADGVARIHRDASPTLRELTITTEGLSDDLVRKLQNRFTLHRWR